MAFTLCFRENIMTSIKMYIVLTHQYDFCCLLTHKKIAFTFLPQTTTQIIYRGVATLSPIYCLKNF